MNGMKKHKPFVVFLDVDGVLNSRTTVQSTPAKRIGVDELRVKLLADSIEKYGGGDIVLTSDWKLMKPEEDDYIYLVEKLGKYGLSISGKTRDNGMDRGAGVQAYLNEHEEIEEYVILDDYKFDFPDYDKLSEHLLFTNGLERAEFASKTPAIEAIIFREYLTTL